MVDLLARHYGVVAIDMVGRFILVIFLDETSFRTNNIGDFSLPLFLYLRILISVWWLGVIFML